jgi:adenosylmethionine-8-amino-7-oxononanoate aminotransferase
LVGATLGAVPPVAGYFRKIREVCDRYGVLLILDEVMCGMRGTGTLFAIEEEGVSPDITPLPGVWGAVISP